MVPVEQLATAIAAKCFKETQSHHYLEPAKVEEKKAQDGIVRATHDVSSLRGSALSFTSSRRFLLSIAL